MSLGSPGHAAYMQHAARLAAGMQPLNAVHMWACAEMHILVFAGVSRIIRPRFAEVANAVGAAIPQVQHTKLRLQTILQHAWLWVFVYLAMVIRSQTQLHVALSAQAVCAGVDLL